jgi:transmembrane sensor
MSDPLAIDTRMESAEEIHARAVDWLLARETMENLTEKSQTELDAWLDESPAHLLAYWRAKSGWKRMEVLTALRSFEPPRSAGRASWFGRQRFRAITGVGAVMVAVGSIASAVLNMPHYTTYTTPVGGHETITLSDGSQIELNTDTLLRLSNDRREAVLDRGEAYFQIRHHVASPFVVATGMGKVVDLGTKFVVRQRQDEVQVALVEGRARFEGRTVGQDHSVVLNPGDFVHATATSVSVARVTASDLSNEVSWRRGVLVFHHMTLAKAASEFNRYNTEKIIVGDAAIGRLEIRGTFRTADVALFARMSEQALGLHTVVRGDEIVITR